MHSSSFDTEVIGKDGGDVLVAIATLVTEGRVPGKLHSKTKGFYEGPHSILNKQVLDHKCDLTDSLCAKFEENRDAVLNLWKKNIPLCVEVFLTCGCVDNIELTTDLLDYCFLLEKWEFNVNCRRNTEPSNFSINQLVNAIRSQLYFSQITAWLSTQDENPSFKLTQKNLCYRITVPDETLESSKFSSTAVKHNFPPTDIGNGFNLKVSFLSLPRMSSVPTLKCSTCTLKVSDKKNTPKLSQKMDKKNVLLDDRMHTNCTLKGKHRCEDYEEFETAAEDHKLATFKRLCQSNKKDKKSTPSCNSEASTSSCKPKLNINFCSYLNKNSSDQQQSKNEKRNISPNIEKKSKSVKLDFDEAMRQMLYVQSHNKNDLKQDKGQLLLDAIERSGLKSTNNNDDACGESYRKCDEKCVQKHECAKKSESDNDSCDMSESDIFSIKQNNNFKVYVDNNHCDSPIPKVRQKKMRDISNIDTTKFSSIHRSSSARQKITFDDDDDNEAKNTDVILENSKPTKDNSTVEIPTAFEQAKFRKNLDNAASMVFHSRTGLPLTSSPAPVRRGKSCFDFDSSITSVSAIKSALFSTSFSTDEESESDGSIVSPCSPEIYAVPKRELSPVKYHRKGHAANLLGSFEESVLNGRLEPVSTVHGFTAELGASGSFVPKHLVVPVTVFFYTLGDNDKVSSPYLSHINLGKKGYNVPKTGTVQVTLFNPLGTVVKMFVIMYDLKDMPPNSQTFIRQRTLYMPTNCKDANLEWGPKWLRYLIHLRFMSSKSGKIYLHSDIRMIIFRKCDMDTATAHGIDMSYELRSFTHMPTNPRFSPRK